MRALVLRHALHDLRAQDREDARVDDYRERQDLPLRLDARAEQHGLVVIAQRLRAEDVAVVLHEEFLKCQRLRILLDAGSSLFRRSRFFFLLPSRCRLRLLFRRRFLRLLRRFLFLLGFFLCFSWRRIVKLSATLLRNRPHMVFCSQGTSWGAGSAHGTSVECNPLAYL